MNHLSSFLIQLRKESTDKAFVTAHKTRFNIRILQFLYKKKYIEHFTVDELKNTIKIFFNNSTFKTSNFASSRLISTPGNKVYKSYKNLKHQYKAKQGTIISTPKGLKQVYELKNKKDNLGGEPILTLPRINFEF